MRKQLLVNPDLQLRVILYAVVITVMTSAIIYFANMYMYYELVFEMEKNGFSDGSPVMSSLELVKSKLAIITILSTGFVSIITVIAALFLSHKIAGPIYKLKKLFDQIAQDGMLTESVKSEISFRKGDFFEDVGVSFNEMIRKIKKES